MPIKPSTASEIADLVGALGSNDDARREAAIARLVIIGPRAVTRLVEELTMRPGPDVTLALLRALDGIGDARGLDAAGRLGEDSDSSVAAAALGLARGHLRSTNASVAAKALDLLTRVALDRTRPDILRLSAIDALLELEPRTVAPVLERLRDDPSHPVRAAVSRQSSADSRRSGTSRAKEDAGAKADLPHDLEAARAFVVARGGSAALPLLHRYLEQAREREAAEGGDARRAGWLGVRAALHQALAARGSRVALYDLRDSFATFTSPLPVGFLAAMAALGDASCLEALAGALSRAPTSGHDWWRERLADAFGEIVRREGLTGRHAVMRRIEKRWPGLLASIPKRRVR